MTTEPPPVGFRRRNTVRPRASHEWQRHPLTVLPLAPAAQAHDRRAMPLIGPAKHPCPLAAVRAGSRQHKAAGDWWRVNVDSCHNCAFNRTPSGCALRPRLKRRYASRLPSCESRLFAARELSHPQVACTAAAHSSSPLEIVFRQPLVIVAPNRRLLAVASP